MSLLAYSSPLGQVARYQDLLLMLLHGDGGKVVVVAVLHQLQSHRLAKIAGSINLSASPLALAVRSKFTEHVVVIMYETPQHDA